MRRHLLILALACVPCLDARADYYLVVGVDNPQASMSQKEAVDLFMGRRHAFRNGDLALVYDLPRDNPDREGFYRALTGLSMAQVNSFWSRLMFAGESRPPQTVPTEAAALGLVRNSPNALVWVAHDPGDSRVHTVLVLKDSK